MLCSLFEWQNKHNYTIWGMISISEFHFIWQTCLTRKKRKTINLENRRCRQPKNLQLNCCPRWLNSGQHPRLLRNLGFLQLLQRRWNFRDHWQYSVWSALLWTFHKKLQSVLNSGEEIMLMFYWLLHIFNRMDPQFIDRFQLTHYVKCGLHITVYWILHWKFYFWFQDAITSSAAVAPATSPTAKPSPTAAAAAALSPSSTSSGSVSSRSPASGHSAKQVMPIYPPNSILATLMTSPPRSTSTSVSSRSSSYASASSTSHAGGSSTSRDVGSYFDRYVKPATSYYDRSSNSKSTTTRSSTSSSRSTWKWCSEYDVILGSDHRWCHISKLSYVKEV